MEKSQQIAQWLRYYRSILKFPNQFRFKKDALIYKFDIRFSSWISANKKRVLDKELVERIVLEKLEKKQPEIIRRFDETARYFEKLKEQKEDTIKVLIFPYKAINRSEEFYPLAFYAEIDEDLHLTLSTQKIFNKDSFKMENYLKPPFFFRQYLSPFKYATSENKEIEYAFNTHQRAQKLFPRNKQGFTKKFLVKDTLKFLYEYKNFMQDVINKGQAKQFNFVDKAFYLYVPPDIIDYNINIEPFQKELINDLENSITIGGVYQGLKNKRALQNALTFEDPFKDKDFLKREDLLPLDVFLNKNHLGQVLNNFPLDASKREALFAYCKGGIGSLFAISGPPGTGKTTILHSVLANEVVTNAIEYFLESPFDDSFASFKSKFIVASSANHQAIENVLESIKLTNQNKMQDAKNYLAQRWIDNFETLGLSLKNDNGFEKYKTLGNIYNWKITNLIPKDPQLHTKFCQNFNKFFSQDLNCETLSLSNRETLESFLTKATITLKKAILQSHKDLQKAIKISKVYFKDLEDSQDKEIWFKKVKSERDKKLAKKDAHLNSLTEILINQNIKITKRTLITRKTIEKRLNRKAWKIIHQELLKSFIELKENQASFLEEFENMPFSTLDKYLDQLLKIQEMPKIADFELLKEKNKLKFEKHWNLWAQKYQDILPSSYAASTQMEEIAAKLDLSYRYELFWLVIHFQEALFLRSQIRDNFDALKERYKNLDENRNTKIFQIQANNLALISPLFISTLHSLPKHFVNRNHHEFEEKYYYEFIDLLIIDEAGQISAELALPSFALSKKVLAVGDTAQIPPVYNVSFAYDKYFAIKRFSLFNDDEENIKYFKSLGYLTTGGSILNIVKYRSKFAFSEKLKGACLLEHRRCDDRIVNFVSKYVYEDALIPLKGIKNLLKGIYAPLDLIYVDGIKQSVATKTSISNINILEAEEIIKELKRKWKTLEKIFKGKKIHQIVAIVSPFKAQSEYIKRLLRSESSRFSKITVGTIHALQGAERELIYYSNVYDKYQNYYWVDGDDKYNILNVATTRARSAFVVFGKREIFDHFAQDDQRKRPSNTPLSNLARCIREVKGL